MNPKSASRLSFSLLVLVAAASNALAQEAHGFTADLPAAQARAKASGKGLLLVFTGSDWCRPCMQLHDEVWSKQEFVDAAGKSWELVVVDSPRGDDVLDAATRARNEALRERFAVNSWPTIFLADAEARPYARTKDYAPGGPKAWLETLATLQQNEAVRDGHRKAADAAKGRERAEHLDAALRACGDFVPLAPYAGWIDELIAADPKDESGVAARWLARRAADALEVDLPKLGKEGKWKELVARIDAFLADYRPEGVVRQKALYWHGVGLLRSGQNERAAKSLTEAVELGAELEYGIRSKQVLERAKKGG